MGGSGTEARLPGRRQRELDLKWSLVWRIVLVAVLCAVGTIAVVMNDVAAEARQRNAGIADAVHRQLELQLLRIDRGTDLPARFPDWDTIVQHALQPGQCIRLEQTQPPRTFSSCRGADTRGESTPAWLAEAYGSLVLKSSDVVRTLVHRGSERGRIVASIDLDAVVDHARRELRRLLGLLAGMIAALCLLVYVAVDHALKPTARILSGINRLAAGELSHRLPRFRLRELQRISEVLNDLAQRLQTTEQDRSELARKLVDAQERERSHFARELHDDVAQRLTALTLLAKSIGDSVPQTALVAASDSARLAGMAAETMRALRRTLADLRPPEIDDLGLRASLQALIADHNRQAEQRIRFTLHAKSSVEALPDEAAVHVYRIVQEGLTNAARHAQARNVTVTLDVLGPAPIIEIDLTIADDGRGPPVEGRRHPGSGLGLIGMRERVYALGGRMTTTARPGGGFLLRIRFATAAQPEAGS